jgi:Cdc6-like AAA superfamily ATPase
MSIFAAMRKHASKAITAVGVSTLAVFCIDLPYAREKRLKFKFKTQIPEFKLNTLPYVSHKKLEEDLEFDLVNSIRAQAGVRIVWSVPGGGKTTTVTHVVNKLLKDGKIGGCIYMTPPADREERPAAWFSKNTSDLFGSILHKNEKLSTVLGFGDNDTKPFVIILDQIEGSFQFDENFEQLVRSLAYDSDRCKSYIVLVMTSDADKARDMYSWNGGTKISFLGASNPW